MYIYISYIYIRYIHIILLHIKVDCTGNGLFLPPPVTCLQGVSDHEILRNRQDLSRHGEAMAKPAIVFRFSKGESRPL